MVDKGERKFAVEIFRKGAPLLGLSEKKFTLWAIQENGKGFKLGG